MKRLKIVPPKRIPLAFSKMGVLALLLATSGTLVSCNAGFDAVSLNPRRAWDYAERQVLVYGSGFTETTTAAVSYVDKGGISQSAPIANLQFIDSYTMVGNLPDLENKLNHLIFPYKEFVAYSALVTPGLYDCTTGAEVLWTPGSSGPYCAEDGRELKYAPYNPVTAAVPPFEGQSPLLYTDWYDLLATCIHYGNPDSTISDPLRSLLIPDYGLGCFYLEDDNTGERIYQYCPLYLPTAEIDVVVTEKGVASTIVNAISLRNFRYDYYNNPDYGKRVKGAYGIYQEVPVNAPEGLLPKVAMASVVLEDGLDYVVLGTLNVLNKSVSLTTDPITGAGGTAETVLTRTPNSLALGDLNSDGFPDVLVTSEEGASTLYTQLNSEGDTLTVQSVSPVVDANLDGFSPSLSAIRDVTNDGFPDIVLAGTDEDGNAKVAVIGVDVDGNLADAQLYAIGEGPVDLVVSQLDSGGPAEIVTLNAVDMTLTVLRNNGAGQFDRGEYALGTLGEPQAIVSSRVLDLASSQYAPTLQDVNDTGGVDVVVLDQQGTARRLLTYSGNGAGVLASGAKESVLGLSAVAGVLGDADGDSYFDAIIVDAEGTLALYKNAGSAGFVDYIDVPTTSGASALLTVDADYDEDEDVLVFSQEAGSVMLMNNPSTLNEYFEVTLAGCAY